MYDAKEKIQLLDQILAIASDPTSKTYEALQHDLLAHKLADEPAPPGVIFHLIDRLVKEVRDLRKEMTEMSVAMETDKKNLHTLWDSMKNQYIPPTPSTYYGSSYGSYSDPFYYW